MFLNRLLLYFLPLLIAAIVGWTAIVMKSVLFASHQRDLIALLPTRQPLTLHPYAPATEVDAQIVNLVHLPLITKSASSPIAPALATEWHWSKTVTLWFGGSNQAQRAAEALSSVPPDASKAWLLNSVSQQAETLRLEFSDPTLANVSAALENLRDNQPQRLSVLRLQTKDNESLAQLSKLLSETRFATNIIRTWTGNNRDIELTIRTSSEAFAAAIGVAYKAMQKPPPLLHRLSSFIALEEPVLSFTLDSHARSHLGQKLTMEDVRQTYLALHRQPSLLATPRAGIHAIDRIEGEGSNQEIVRVVYRRFYGPALCDWIDLPILPAEWWRSHPDQNMAAALEKEKVPGFGPLLIESHNRDEMIFRVASQTSDKGSSQRLCIERKDSTLSTDLSMEAGLLDLFWPDDDSAESLEQGFQFTIHKMPAHSATRVIWNLRSEPLSEPLVRQAIGLATNRSELVNKLLHGGASAQSHLFAPCLWTGQIDFMAPDLHRAEALLAQAGYLKNVAGIASRPGLPLSIELFTDASNPSHAAIAAELAQQWRALGVTTVVQVIDQPDEFAQRLALRQFQAALVTEKIESTWDQFAYLHSSRDRPEGLNLSGLHDRGVDLLLEALAQEFSPELATHRFEKLQATLQQLQPSLPLLFSEQPIAIRSSRDAKYSPATGFSKSPAWNLNQVLLAPQSQTTPSP